MKYHIADTITGTHLYSGHGPKAQALIDSGDGIDVFIAPPNESWRYVWDGVSWIIGLNSRTAERLKEISDLYISKLVVGVEWSDAPGGAQTVETSLKDQAFLHRLAARAERAERLNNPYTFNNFRFAGRIKVNLSSAELSEMVAFVFDWGKTLDDVQQDHKDAILDIEDGAGTDAEKVVLIDAYDIEIGW